MVAYLVPRQLYWFKHPEVEIRLVLYQYAVPFDAVRGYKCSVPSIVLRCTSASGRLEVGNGEAVDQIGVYGDGVPLGRIGRCVLQFYIQNCL